MFQDLTVLMGNYNAMLIECGFQDNRKDVALKAALDQQDLVSTYKIVGWFISGVLLYSIAEK